MSDDVIEPDEILVERKANAKAEISHVNPWIRCIARFFDYSLFFLLLLSIRKLFLNHLIPYEFFLWIPIEALCLSTWGTTPGKWFLKTNLKFGKLNKPDYMLALKRSFSVWFRGLGMGLPILNFFCLLVAYNKLKMMKITSWDRDDRISVTHHRIGKWRIYFAVFVAIGGILYYYSEKNQEYNHASARQFRSLNEHLLRELKAPRSDISS